MRADIILNRGIHRRRAFLGVVATLALVVGQLALWSAAAGAATCTVRNLTTKVTGSSLQAAISAASNGDTLKVKGVCGSGFTIDKDLTLVGPATLDFQACGLPDCGYGTVLGVDAGNVTLRNVTITNGFSTFDGGGVWNYGTLILTGTSSVSGNVAEDGAGGIYNFGTLVLNGHSSVSGNGLYYGWGGGIWNVGTLTMNGSSSVTGNTAGMFGGGGFGGGIFNEGTVNLNGSSSVTGNIAGEGGGILNEGTVNFAPDWEGTVCGNDPDDWPTCAA